MMINCHSLFGITDNEMTVGVMASLLTLNVLMFGTPVVVFFRH